MTAAVALRLSEKLERFDADAARSYFAMLAYLGKPDAQARILKLARERHIAGHALYGDKHLYEYDHDRLRSELDEELADGIVYMLRSLTL